MFLESILLPETCLNKREQGPWKVAPSLNLMDHICGAKKSHYGLIFFIWLWSYFLSAEISLWINFHYWIWSYFLCPEIILWIDFLHLNLIIFFLKSWILKTIFCERIDLSSFEFYHILCAKKSYYELIVFIWLW